MSKLSQSRAFVVQLSDETDRSAGLPSGRIEHVDSGLRGRFSCREELWQFIELENATLTNLEGFLADAPTLTLTINRSDLELTMMGAKELSAQIADGTAKIEGDAMVLEKLASTMVEFDPRFPIMPGTEIRQADAEEHNAYEAVPGNPIAE